VQVINRLHDYPRQIAPRPFPSREHVGEVGELRLLMRVIGWEGTADWPCARIKRQGDSR
jgi:hypothetical protein